MITKLPILTLGIWLTVNAGCTPSFNHPLPEKITPLSSPCSETNYDRAQFFAHRSLDALNDYDGRQERIRIGEGASALAIATAAGGVAAYGGGTDVLRGLAIGGAAVLGLDTLLDPNRKSAVVNAGRKAIYCAIQSAQAVHFGKDGVPGALTAQVVKEITGATVTRETALSKAANPESAVKAQASFLGIGKGTMSNLRTVSGNSSLEYLGALQVAKATNAQIKQARALQELGAEMNAANASAAVRLSLSICAINDEIAAQLRSGSPDPGTILTKQREAVDRQLGGIVEKKEESEEASEETATPGTEEASNCAADSPECAAKVLAASSLDLQSLAAPAEAVYEDCVKLSAPAKQE